MAINATVDSLPTLPSLGVTAREVNLSPTLQPAKVAAGWLDAFQAALARGDPKDILNLFHKDPWWRDMLALTWDFRTFRGEGVEKLLKARILDAKLGFKDLKIAGGEAKDPVLQQPFVDVLWIQFFFSFSTAAGKGIGIVRLVPVSTIPGTHEWKAHQVYTTLDNLDGHPEKIGRLRHVPSVDRATPWQSLREEELSYKDRDPAVVIIGGGQSGLDVAARLKTLGVDALILEKNAEIGEQWKKRYLSLTLHDPVWYDHMPYLPFPPTWPAYSPAAKLAGWLKSYAETMELNIWTSVDVRNVIKQDDGTWVVTVRRADTNEERVLKPRHVVFAIGLAGSVPNMPQYPGMDQFKGEIHHSTQHGSASEYIGKKALVVGACTSGHDIAHDFHNHGVDVTLHQRSSTYIMSTKNGWDVLFKGTYEEGGPPTEVSDLLTASFPHYLAKWIQTRATSYIKDLDKEVLDGLEKVGFKLNSGIDGSGFPLLAWTRAGGYYLDVGASRLIADGKIKLISGTPIKQFTASSVVFEDGSEVQADVVVFATGFGDGREPIQKLLGESLEKSGEQLQPLWGLNREGEIYAIWRGSGVKNLWVMMGNLALCRFHSKHVALQIKALEEGIWDGKRYESPT